MAANVPKPDESMTATLELAGPDWRLRTEITVPTAPRRLRQILPVIQLLTEDVVNTAIRQVEGQGQTISCRKGCGACCRQLVPIADAEARQIASLLDELPEPRRSVIRDRFAEAHRRLAESGMLQKLDQREHWVDGDTQPLGLEYFHLGIPCPFLEEEACSIHPNRPVACREYLVTSPAENCSRPTKETVRCVPLPLKVSAALRRCEAGAEQPPRWVPLILAPDWAHAHPDEPPARQGPKWVEALVTNLTGKALP